MRRAGFPELQGRRRPHCRHRRRTRPDRVLLGLKIATFGAAGGLIGMIILFASGGSDVAGRAPAEQRIGTGPPDAGGPSNAPAPTTSTRQPTMIAPPALRTETTNIAGPPSRPPEPSLTRPPAPPDPGFAVIGERCPEVGMFSITRTYEPVMCSPPSGNGPPRWDRIF